MLFKNSDVKNANYAEKIQRMASQPSGRLMEHAMRIGVYGEALDGNRLYINGFGVGDKRMKLDELAYECVNGYAVSSMASRLGKALDNVVYMPPVVARTYGKHDLEYAGMMKPVRKKAGKFDMPMDSSVVSTEARANMHEVFKQCTETVGLCERVHMMMNCHKNAVKTKDDAQERFWRNQLGSYLPAA